MQAACEPLFLTLAPISSGNTRQRAVKAMIPFIHFQIRIPATTIFCRAPPYINCQIPLDTSIHLFPNILLCKPQGRFNYTVDDVVIASLTQRINLLKSQALEHIQLHRRQPLAHDTILHTQYSFRNTVSIVNYILRSFNCSFRIVSSNDSTQKR